MKGLPTLIRVRKWELEEKRRRLTDLEGLADQLDGMISRLEEEVRLEQEIARGNEEVTYSYGSYAQTTIDRRRKLEASLDDVKKQIEAAKEEVTSAYQELKKYEVAQTNRRRRAKDEVSRKEQIGLDEISVEQFRRRDTA